MLQGEQTLLTKISMFINYLLCLPLFLLVLDKYQDKMV